MEERGAQTPPVEAARLAREGAGSALAIPARRVADLAAGLVGLDVLVTLVTGSATLVPGVSGASPRWFLLRLGVLAGLAVLRLWRWGGRDAAALGRTALALALLATLAQFHLAGGRINGDGVMYYVYTRSLVKDADLDFTNEYTHYDLADRDDLAMLTDTGLRRSIFAVGPGLSWIPFFLAGEIVARLHQLVQTGVDLSGYGPHHRNACALGSVTYGFLTILLIRSLLRRHFRGGVADGVALLVWGATFLHWYMVQQPMMAHAASAFGAAALIWRWDRGRQGRAMFGYLGLGLLGGLAMCLRWQNGVLLILPGLDLLLALKDPRRRGRAVFSGVLLVAGALAGAIPQMLAWKIIYGSYLLPHPPHGADFLRLDHPYFLHTLFSSRHGLISWTPVFWPAFLGFVPLVRRRPLLALPLLVPLVLMTYINACSGDWWAGASFSIRRFDSQLAILAVGLAAAVETLLAGLRRWPGLVPIGLAASLTLWNVGAVRQVASGAVDRNATVTFPALAGGSARMISDSVGSPQAWPANWLFAWQQGRPAGQYDRLVGRYLFYRQNNMDGRVNVGQPEDEVMLGEGWGPRELHLGIASRSVSGRARLFAPLDVPEDLGVRVRASADDRLVTVLVNGQEAGSFVAGPAWSEHEVRVPAARWRRELNDVVLDAGSALVHIDMVNFMRQPGSAE